jgi:WD40 repeat protein/effector-binding domain-containing protein
MVKSVSIDPNTGNNEARDIKNPFPGLRAFNHVEKHLFFGRDGQSEKVLELLTTNRFIAIIGPSGSGKSSLINCGIIPQLYGGYLYEAGSRWKIARMHPGYSPIESLSITLTESFASPDKTPEQIQSETNLNYVLFTKKALEISTLVGKIENYQKENILIFIDQFEELFRFTAGIDKKNPDIDESLLLINLLVEALKQDKVPIYVVICVRSDFVGNCSNYQTLTEYINLSHYLVPQMTREAYRSAILGPTSLTDAQVSPDVLQEILNHIGNKPDQLPVLQHLMMRLYNFWKANKKPDQPINIYDYKAVGGLEEAISHHTEELYNELSENEKIACKKIFQTITESGADNKGIRRPTSIANILRISKCSREDVYKVANLYRAEGNSIITPDIVEELSDETVLDISHEAVMRNWKRLKSWIEEESDAVQLYLRLIDASMLYQSGKTGPWRPPELFLAISWRNNFKPNEIWASQYHPAYVRSMKFLEISEASYKEEEALREKARGREIRRTRGFAIILAIAAVVAVVFMINSIKLRKVADEARIDEQKQRELAEAAGLEAQMQKTRAENYAVELEKQNAIIEANLLVRTDERDVAVRYADEAVQQTVAVEASLAEVSDDLDQARSATDAALEEARRIERERQQAYMDNIVLLSQTLANTSLEITYDSELKALLAYQSFKFNERSGGLRNQANIYLGLRNALQGLDVRYEIIYPGHAESVRSVVYAPKNRWMFSAGSNGRLIRWDRFEGMPNPQVIIKNNGINQVLAVSKDERWLVCGCEGLGIQVFDLSNPGSSPRIFSAHQNRIRALQIYNDNRSMLSCGLDNTIYKWDLETGIREVFHELASPPKSIAISGNDQNIAVGTGDGQLLVFSGRSDQPLELSNETGNPILSLAFRNDRNTLISADQKGWIKIWAVDLKDLVWRKRLHQARINEIKVDPSKRFLATSSTDGKVLVLDLEDLAQPPIEIININGFVYSVEFINRGQNIVVGSKSSNTLVSYPVRMEDLAKFICPNINRNLSPSEWRTHIGEDVPFEETCSR